MDPDGIFLTKDFILNVDKASKPDDFSSDQVSYWNNRFDESYKNPTRQRDATASEKQTCADEVASFLENTRRVCQKHMLARMIDYAAKYKKIKRPDGQFVTSWGDLFKWFSKHKGTDDDEITYSCLYDTFPPLWTQETEPHVLVELKLHYRDGITVKGRSTKSFIQKTLTKALKEYRAKVTWIKRRRTAEIDNNGNKKRRRLIHKSKFDPKKHVYIDLTNKRYVTLTIFYYRYY